MLVVSEYGCRYPFVTINDSGDYCLVDTNTLESRILWGRELREMYKMGVDIHNLRLVLGGRLCMCYLLVNQKYLDFNGHDAFMYLDNGIVVYAGGRLFRIVENTIGMRLVSGGFEIYRSLSDDSYRAVFNFNNMADTVTYGGVRYNGEVCDKCTLLRSLSMCR